ncbi:hypothetical protein PPACK8108_LOCUS3375 [Phakopsora pachyrhizi]|uniref:Uncharacterized protein n=1 Tax=Phakopsora pachyrhizi TaxID=170000 RepID=A0AAV0ALH3_PHAPC|nr:hypothetical protein PPACK8108_LOCUS3375 [Phakopsora pachyrhizi]
MVAEDEDAPDLYRISALGLYEGELEPEHCDTQGYQGFGTTNPQIDWTAAETVVGKCITVEKVVL